MVTTPNYQWCLAYCSGLDKHCLNYEANKPFRVCKHYKLVHQEHKEGKTLEEQDLEKLVRLAGSIY